MWHYGIPRHLYLGEYQIEEDEPLQILNFLGEVGMEGLENYIIATLVIHNILDLTLTETP